MPKLVCPTCACVIFFESGTEPEEDVCPGCGGDMSEFIEMLPEPQEASSRENLLDAEECHIPFYRETPEQIFVRVGTEDNPHPMEDEHHIEYVGLYDEDGEEIARHEFSDLEEEATCVFEHPGIADYEVRATCNRHGVWRGMAESEEDTAKE